MRLDSGFALKLSILIFIIGSLLSITGLCQAPITAILFILISPENVGGMLIHFFALYFFSRNQLKDAYKVILISFAGVFLHYAFLKLNGEIKWLNWEFVFFFWFGLVSLVTLVIDANRNSKLNSSYNQPLDLLTAGIAGLFYGVIVYSFLDLTVKLHPITFDSMALHIDQNFGFQPSLIMGKLFDHFYVIKIMAKYAYSFMPVGFSIVYAYQARSEYCPPANIIVVLVISGILGTIGYHLCPISGPHYLLGNQFPGLANGLDSIAKYPTLVGPAPRNGMPSLHFGWTFLMLLNVIHLRQRLLTGFFSVLLFLIVLATLGLGEHYLIDLVAGFNFAIAAQALCMSINENGRLWRNRTLLIGVGNWLLFVVIVRWGLPIFEALPGLIWLISLVTMASSLWAYRQLNAYVVWLPRQIPQPIFVSLFEFKTRLLDNPAKPLLVLFFISGFAGLIYEVLFARILALTFGGQATATYTVLAVYMGGMALGAWLGGKIAQKRADTVLLYAYCELGIALYCIATPFWFGMIKSLYVTWAGDLPADAEILVVLRVALGSLALLLPTVLMGMTLPLLMKSFNRFQQSCGQSVAVLYGANTLGAALGALLAGYLILPFLGIINTTFLCATLNLIVALLGIEYHKHFILVDRGFLLSISVKPETLRFSMLPSLRHLYAALLVLGVGGAGTLILEINYMQLLAVVAGNSTYAFSLMLFTFLLGLAAGAELARQLLKTALSLLGLLGALELALGSLILIGISQWDGMPSNFAAYGGYPITLGFGARETIRGIVCWFAMFPPALIIGMIYPVAMEIIDKNSPQGQGISMFGNAAALNTFGNIIGVLFGAFLLLPWLGVLKSLQVLAAISFLLGFALLILSPWNRRVWASAMIILVGGLFFMQPKTLNYQALATGANVYFQPTGWGDVIDHAESVDGGLTTVVRNKSPVTGESILTLLTNGKFQGNNASKGEVQAQVGFALSPLLHTPKREQALVIGYGTGTTSRTLKAAGFSHLDIVDLSADVITLANRYFYDINDRVTEKNGVNTYITDGRNFLLLQSKKYDVIGLELTSIWFAGAASLYNQEFYQLAKQRLKPDGVLQQWVQLHHLDSLDMLHIIGSVRAEFNYVWLYEIGGQGMIIATNDSMRKPSLENASQLNKNTNLTALLQIYGQGAEKLLNNALLSPSAIDKMLTANNVPENYWLSTDDNLFLEYHTPRGNSLNAEQSSNQNRAFLGQFKQM